jgi:DNA-directed RNA polymerase alpha subunit
MFFLNEVNNIIVSIRWDTDRLILQTGSNVLVDDQDKVSSVRGIMREHMPKVVERLKKLGVRIISKSIPADKLEEIFPGKVQTMK